MHTYVFVRARVSIHAFWEIKFRALSRGSGSEIDGSYGVPRNKGVPPVVVYLGTHTGVISGVRTRSYNDAKLAALLFTRYLWDPGVFMNKKAAIVAAWKVRRRERACAASQPEDSGFYKKLLWEESDDNWKHHPARSRAPLVDLRRARFLGIARIPDRN